MVITEVSPDSDAAEKNIATGQVIVEVQGTKVKTPDEVKTQVAEKKKSGKKSVLLLIADGKGELRFVAVPVEKLIGAPRSIPERGSSLR